MKSKHVFYFLTCLFNSAKIFKIVLKSAIICYTHQRKESEEFQTSFFLFASVYFFIIVPAFSFFDLSINKCFNDS